jgi:hypothetical protein
MDRYARQRLLTAVGDRGQERIAQATFVVDGAQRLAAETEREYLTRAGAQRFAEASAARAPFTHAAVFRHAAARDFAEGAWRALAQLRTSLEPSP